MTPTLPRQPNAPRRETPAATSAVHWQREVPEEVRSLGALPGADYADIVTATIDETPDKTPDELIGAVLKSVPRGLLIFIPFVQRVFLGFRLQLRPSPDRLLGWKIADRGKNWIRIEVASWFMTAHVVMHIDEGKMSLASFIRYDRWPAAFVWPPVCLIHRRVALILARSAIRAAQ